MLPSKLYFKSKMRTQVSIIFLLICLICCYSAVPEIKNCSSCVGYQSCDAFVVAIEKNEPAVDDQLKSAFCGFDGFGLPMVCCSELTAAVRTLVVDSVENHRNLRLLPHDCGKGGEDDDKTIIGGGRPATLYQFPWMVLLGYKTRQGPMFKCGGSLINNLYVLTAAHCLSGEKVLGVRIGENNMDTAVDCQIGPTPACESHIEDIHIEEAIPHPGFQRSPAIRNDIGLIRLKKPVNLTFENAGIICLPVTKDLQNRNIGGIEARVAGWGFTEHGLVSSRLLMAVVPIHTAEKCRELYKGKKPGEDDTINKICAGDNGRDACRGDSGGPLMVRTGPTDPYIQYGIVSYGPRLCGSEFPGVYTDVSKYIKWILDTIKP